MEAYRYQRVPDNKCSGSQDVLKTTSDCLFLPERYLVLVQIQGPFVYANPEQCFRDEGMELSVIFGNTKKPSSDPIKSVAVVKQIGHPNLAVRMEHYDERVGTVTLQDIARIKICEENLDSILYDLETVETKVKELYNANYSAFHSFRKMHDRKDNVHEVEIKF